MPGESNYPPGKCNYRRDKRNYPSGKRNYPSGERNYPAGERNYPSGESNYPPGKRDYPPGKRDYPRLPPAKKPTKWQKMTFFDENRRNRPPLALFDQTYWRVKRRDAENGHRDGPRSPAKSQLVAVC